MTSRLLTAMLLAAPGVMSTACSTADSDTTRPAGAPEAVIEADDPAPDVGETVTLDASNSTDPNNDPLAYRWELLSMPSGSAAELDTATPDLAELTPDLEGTYIVEVSVDDGTYVDSATLDITATATSCADPLTIADDITTETTWESTGNVACIDYRVTAPITVGAPLDVLPGVQVEFSAGAGLKVTGEGALAARGTEEDPIQFFGAEETPGFWESIVFDNDATANTLEHVEVAWGGAGEDFSFSGNTAANVYVTNDGAVEITRSTFRDGNGTGLTLAGGATLRAFSTNSFRDNAGPPLRLYSHQLGDIDGASTYAGANGEPYIAVEASTTATSQTWPATDLPYRFSEIHILEPEDGTNGVTLAAGARILFAQGAGIRVDNGFFRADGQENAPVSLLGEQQTPGHWEAVVFNSNSPQNALINTRVAHGGLGEDFSFSGNTPAEVIVTGSGQLELEGSTLADSGQYGLYLEEGAVLVHTDNRYEGNKGAPVTLASNQLGMLDAASDYDGSEAERPNDDAYIWARGSTITRAQTWPATDLPTRMGSPSYIELSDATGVVAVDAGTHLEFGDGAGIRVDAGAFTAIGTAEDMIRMTGAVETAGYWESIVFDSNNPVNEIAHAEIAHGGKGEDFSFSRNTAALVVVTSDGQATLRDSFLIDSGDFCTAGGGDLTTSGLTTQNCR